MQILDFRSRAYRSCRYSDEVHRWASTCWETEMTSKPILGLSAVETMPVHERVYHSIVNALSFVVVFSVSLGLIWSFGYDALL